MNGCRGRPLRERSRANFPSDRNGAASRAIVVLLPIHRTGRAIALGPHCFSWMPRPARAAGLPPGDGPARCRPCGANLRLKLKEQGLNRVIKETTSFRRH